MGMIQTSQAELEAFYAYALPGFLDYLKSHSTSVGGVELATTLEGITSLPARQSLGGVEKNVLAPLSLLSAGAESAAASASAAAAKANTAADNADAAAGRVTDAITDISAEKTAAQQAASSANSAATSATNAASSANAAASSANAAATSANDAATAAANARSEAETATADCEDATNKARTATGLAQDAATAANGAASSASSAATAASSAASDANGAAQRCEELEGTLTAQARQQPTGMTLDYPSRLLLSQKEPKAIEAVLTPAGTGRNVLFLGDDEAVSVSPDGHITVNAAGRSRVHVIPTENTSIYRTIEIYVIEAPMRLHATGSIRLTSSGDARMI